MKAVMISIRPEWCEKIASGEKTVEVRKTRPKIEPPFKVYIYCTSGPPYLNSHNGYVYLEECDVLGYRGQGLYKRLNTGVIGEFVCDRIDYWNHHIHDDDTISLERASEMSLVSEDDLVKYADLGHFYAWHISDLVIYEKPRQLFDFYKCGAESMDELSDREELCQYCSDTGYGEYATYSTPNGPVMCEGQFCDKAYQEYLDENFALTRPPQSWCYVEGGE